METKYLFEYTHGRIAGSDAFPDGHDAKRPKISVFLRYGNRRTKELSAVVDTGADYCQFPAWILDDLELAYDSLPAGQVTGLGTDPDSRFANVILEVPSIGEWTIRAGFSKMGEADTHLLGHQGFLERFLVCFDYRNGKFGLEERPPE